MTTVRTLSDEVSLPLFSASLPRSIGSLTGPLLSSTNVRVSVLARPLASIVSAIEVRCLRSRLLHGREMLLWLPLTGDVRPVLGRACAMLA